MKINRGYILLIITCNQLINISLRLHLMQLPFTDIVYHSLFLNSVYWVEPVTHSVGWCSILTRVGCLQPRFVSSLSLSAPPPQHPYCHVHSLLSNCKTKVAQGRFQGSLLRHYLLGLFDLYLQTERRCRVVNTLPSYSESPGFKSLPGERLLWLRFSWFPQFLQANSGITP
jgi:hypothetical protein